MTRNDCMDQIVARTQRSKAEAEHLIAAALAVIADALARGEKVDLRGFGSFQVSGKKERQGRNPRTGESNNDSSEEGGPLQAKQGAGRSCQRNVGLWRRD